MKKLMISVKDNVSELFADPRVEINAASAIRAFTASVKESPHKDDYSLYVVGEFDVNNGNIAPCEPQRIYSGHDVKVDNVVGITE